MHLDQLHFMVRVCICLPSGNAFSPLGFGWWCIFWNQVSSMSSSSILWKQEFVERGTVTLAIDRNGGSLLIFEKKCPNDATLPKSAPNSHSLWVHRLLNDGVWIVWAPNTTILLIDLIDLLSEQWKMYWKIGLIEWGTVRPAVAVI